LYWLSGTDCPELAIINLDAGEQADQSAGCCARAASGHTAAAPPISVMNSRRLTDELQDALVTNPLGNKPHQDLVVDPVEELFQVDIHDKAVAGRDVTMTASARVGFLCIEQRAIRNRVGTVLHILSLTVGTRHRARVEMVAADHNRCSKGKGPLFVIGQPRVTI
jgi:hypothetical protein